MVRSVIPDLLIAFLLTTCRGTGVKAMQNMS